MSRRDDTDQVDRLLTLQEKETQGLLTPLEQQELMALLEDSSTGTATKSQQEYIETLLDKLGADLCDYGYDDVTEIAFDDASDLIDILKDDVTAEGAWEY